LVSFSVISLPFASLKKVYAITKNALPALVHLLIFTVKVATAN